MFVFLLGYSILFFFLPFTDDFVIDKDRVVVSVVSDFKRGSKKTGDSCKAGYSVFFKTNNKFNASSSLKGKITRPRAQLCALSTALVQIQDAGLHKVRIDTQFDYIQKYFPQLKSWAKNNWRTGERKQGNLISNMQEWKTIHELSDQKDIEFNFTQSLTDELKMSTELARSMRVAA